MVEVSADYVSDGAVRSDECSGYVFNIDGVHRISSEYYSGIRVLYRNAVVAVRSLLCYLVYDRVEEEEIRGQKDRIGK